VIDPSSRLAGKVLIVTGATRGIGLATAHRLAAEGARVLLTARREQPGREIESRLREAGSDVAFVAADMTDEAGAPAVVNAAIARYGQLDGAFNNVGGVAAPGRPGDIDPTAWAAELPLNLTSVFYCLRAQVPALLAAGGGSVVNTRQALEPAESANWPLTSRPSMVSSASRAPPHSPMPPTASASMPW
jgi:NAD(P)-dependent dehydrogenase (short-subunit alcohol dehydrogenase family)